MSVVHYGAVKIILIASITAGAAFAVMDPTTKGYVIAGCIAAIPPTITGIFNHWKISAVERKVDGMNTALSVKADNAVSELADASNKLAHADGRREGVESTEEKHK
jgi:hypothetical protein